MERFVIEGNFPYSNRHFFVQHLVPYVFFKHLCQGKHILEIGTGDGFGSFYLSQGSCAVVALDLDFSRSQCLKRLIEGARAVNIHFVNADALALPFLSHSFDAVIACQVIEHIPQDRLTCFLAEIHRVLKDDGACLLVTLNVENNIKNAATYEKFYQHHKEFNKQELHGAVSEIFPSVEVFGLGVSLRHRVFRRLKRWGIRVESFYEHIVPGDFSVTRDVSRHSLDLFALCRKGEPE